MVMRGTAPYNLGQFAEVEVSILRALPKALEGTDPKILIPLLQKSGEAFGEKLGELLRSIPEEFAQDQLLLGEFRIFLAPATNKQFVVDERFGGAVWFGDLTPI